jgi:CBS domain-containing protein
VRDVLAGVEVGQFVTPQQVVPGLLPSDSLATVIDRLSKSSYQVLPVLDAEKRLLGMVSLEEVHLAALSPHLRPLVLATDLMRSDVTPLRRDDRLDRAVELFAENDLMALPVVDGSADRRVVGLVHRTDVSAAYLRRVHGAASGAR